MNDDTLNNYSSKLHGHVSLVLIGQDGKSMTIKERLELSSHEPDDDEWSYGLTMVRQTMYTKAHARVV